jgi:hypothetical protein
MAKIQRGSKNPTNHSLLKGLTSRAPDVQDASRKISSKKTVNDEAIRTGVAVGDSERGPDKGVLK